MLNTDKFLELFSQDESFNALLDFLKQKAPLGASLKGMAGSSPAVLAAAAVRKINKPFLFLLSDKEAAAYFFNDLENLLGERDTAYEKRNSFFFPSSYKSPFQSNEEDNGGILLRSEVINRLVSNGERTIVVTYPEALCENVVSQKVLKKNLLSIRKGEQLSVDFLLEVLLEEGFERVDFVVEPGQFSVRGGIIDVFSFSNDHPFRVEIMGDQVESLRTFNTESQLSLEIQEKISILPDIHAMSQETRHTEFLLNSMPSATVVWSENLELAADIVHEAFASDKIAEPRFIPAEELLREINRRLLVEFHKPAASRISDSSFTFNFSPQPNFNKHIELLRSNLEENTAKGLQNIILCDTQKQAERIRTIFETIRESEDGILTFQHEIMLMSLHEGFIDHQHKVACYTDHQIFDRYHRYRIRDKFPGKQALSIKALYNLKPGDYVTHIDHGIGIFSGLEKIEVNGRLQEAIRLIYKNEDILYVSIHSLHRVSKYTGKEGVAPSLHRLGSGAWSKLKNKTRKKVKDIARDLIALYAKRREQKGHAFSADSYLQHELEASFMYEDTPDQEKATLDVKKDMESPCPMDRLICGDVGFGKTEVAIRAAFKAVTDSKQVAVLVPTTILALQHYYTFRERLRDFPCTIDYVSRFRTAPQKKKTLQGVKDGSIDILIGTHRLLSKDVRFRDLGLLVVDEEQKFGVSSKEKLKQLRVNVDTLTLTATPIPRTLQFSLMGARDLSYINTPPPNRYPIITELHEFNEDLIRDTVNYEISRGGQVFFVHNRVQNIAEVAEIIRRNCPDARIAIGHGQLDGSQLEKVMVDFIHGAYDVLVSTTIIESGLDIPNANTIIINNANHFGLSDLHQMRGRVGRTNKKAFCYLLSPPMSTLTEEARRRLKAIEEFSELGSGFNIAMRDLDIRGAGNLLGAEQSGFISEVGFDTYHKILDEAISELKENEFREVFSGSGESAERENQVEECQLETDLELMIPSDYVSNIEERLQLYKELDNIETEAQLQAFAGKIEDRFGPLPDPAKGLLKVVRLRRKAQSIGFEKLILKTEKMIGYLPDSDRTGYYQSEVFGQILQYVQNHSRQSRIKEMNGHLSLTIKQVKTIEEALEIITDLSGFH